MLVLRLDSWRNFACLLFPSYFLSQTENISIKVFISTVRYSFKKPKYNDNHSFSIVVSSVQNAPIDHIF